VFVPVLVPRAPNWTDSIRRSSSRPAEAVDFYSESLKLLKESEIPFLLSGTYALSCFTGITRPTKDLDVFCKPSDAPKILAFFKGRGFDIEIEDERWIGKVWRGDNFFDVIYNIAPASIPITDEWFKQVCEAEVYGTTVRITPPTQFILSKLFLQTRYRYDGADVAHTRPAAQPDRLRGRRQQMGVRRRRRKRGLTRSMNDHPADRLIVAAVGDLHVTESADQRFHELFAGISDAADVLALCGDLTNFGKTHEAELLAEDLRGCTIPTVAVLGNHDYECGQPEEVARILHQAGVTMLDEQAVVIEGVGFAGVKGFVGGFGRGELGAFGEHVMKTCVDESRNEARKLENQLRSLRTDRTVAVLHYAPVADTVEGEPLEIFPFLGSSRLAHAVHRFENVKAVVHGHGHRGSYEGKTAGGVPVYNCARFVVQQALGVPSLARNLAGRAGRGHGAPGLGGRLRRVARIEQSSGLDRVERPPRIDIALGRGHPFPGILPAGHAQHFGERHVDLPRLKPPRRPQQPLRRQGRRSAALAHRDQARKLGLERAPQILVGRGAGEVRADFLKPELKLLQRDRLARGGDDGRHRRPLGFAETVAQQPFDIAERDAAIERAAGGERHQQPFGPVGIAHRGARLHVDMADALFERRHPARHFGIDDKPLRLVRRGRGAAGEGAWLRLRPDLGRRLGGWGGGLQAEKTGGGAPIGEQPGHGRDAADEGEQRKEQQRQQRPAPDGGAAHLLIHSHAPDSVASKASPLHSFAATSSNAWSRGTGAIATAAHARPAAAAAAGLIAATAICAGSRPAASTRLLNRAPERGE
jgi:Icc-related predicted phosphoesterase